MATVLSASSSSSSPPPLELRFRSQVSAFISTAITATEPDEVAAFGTRGDGKTFGAFGVMIAHAQQHHAQGGELPTKWLGAADTFASHVAKTHESLMEPFWRGTWSLRDQGHIAVFTVDGTELVHLRLLGVEDQAGQDRLRAASHGLWFEEPAPSSVLVQSTGLSESSWGLGITSCRMPSYKNPKIMTLNYPDEDHWTWQRFVVRQDPGTSYVRIPPGERASEEQRARWKQALANRPDMLRRLLLGQPGTIVLGPQVAVGFNRDTHVRACRPSHHVPIWLGQDAGHTPTTVVAQRVDGRCRILAAIASEHDGMRGHIRDLVLPWLGEHAPWALDSRDYVTVVYDPATDTDEQADIETNALRVMQQLLPGKYRPGPVSWDGRKDPMLSLLNAMHLGEPMLQIDPVHAKGLIKALDGGWYYAQAPDGSLRKADTRTGSAQPKKPNHPHEDYGDAFCYLVAGMAPLSALTHRPRAYSATNRGAFSLRDVTGGRR